MSRFQAFCTFLILLGATYPARAASDSADAPHVHVRLIVVPTSLALGKPAKAGLYFKLEQGWHVYWQYAGDAGEPPHLHWTLPKGISAGPLQFPAPQRLPLGPLMDYGYEDEVLFPFTIEVADSAASGPAQLRAHIDWLVCRATCIPGKADLELTRNVDGRVEGRPGPDKALYDRFEALLPQSLPSTYRAWFAPTLQGFGLRIITGRRETEAVFFPSDQGIVDNPAPQLLTPTEDGALLLLKKDAGLTSSLDVLKGVVELAGGRVFSITAKPAAIDPALLHAATVAAAATPASATAQPAVPVQQESEEQGHTLWGISGLAFLGGILLNLMPCVFPVLFLKGLALVRSGHEEQETLRRHGFVYAAGIIVSFWILVGVLLSLRAAGAVLGWGFQFQSPVFLEWMAAFLFFLGLSLAGQFDLGLSLTSAGGTLATKQGYAGSFFTGVLAVIVATPCTGPFMAAAIGYALSQPALVTFVVFTSLALGLAAPYVVLTFQPAWTHILPRPGAWMDVLKQATSVPIFAFVIWLAWVLAQAYGAALLATLLVCFLLLAIAGWFLGRWQTRRWATVVAAALVLVVAFLGYYAPHVFAGEKQSSATSSRGGIWETWSPDAVRRYSESGRPVFVDFTAGWCLSCQVNERVALDRPEVQEAFRQNHVALLRADWTRHDEAITAALTALGRDGVPAYALYRPGENSPQLLPQVLTPGIVLNALAQLKR
jgi:thiol:disulfide interchange protein/DsbC/DsbD-like thiol-disulfide interchange protein